MTGWRELPLCRITHTSIMGEPVAVHEEMNADMEAPQRTLFTKAALVMQLDAALAEFKRSEETGV